MINKVIEIKEVGKIIISERLKKQIDYLHRVVGNIEWSGVLVYNLTSGDLSTLKDLVFTGVAVYPMDIGSHAYTEFSYNAELVGIYEKIPEAMEMNIGLIHTHHNFGSFMSGTDKDEIKTNAEHYNFYLSLIVAKDDKYTCKIAFPSTVTSESTSIIKGLNGEDITFRDTAEEKVIYLGDLVSEFEVQPVEVEDWLVTNIVELKQEKVKKAQEKAKSATVVNKTGTLPAKTYGEWSANKWKKDDMGYTNDWYNWDNETKNFNSHAFEETFKKPVVKEDIRVTFVKGLLTASFAKADLAEFTLMECLDGLIEIPSVDVDDTIGFIMDNLSEVHDEIYFGNDLNHPDANSMEVEADHVKDAIKILEIYGNMNVKKLVKKLKEYAYEVCK